MKRAPYTLFLVCFIVNKVIYVRFAVQTQTQKYNANVYMVSDASKMSDEMMNKRTRPQTEQYNNAPLEESLMASQPSSK